MAKPVPGVRKSPKIKPGQFPTLLQYLRKSGQVHQISKAQLYKVRHLFVTKGWSASEIAEHMKLPPAVIERWVIAFSWVEERDRRLFSKLRSMKAMKEKASEFLDERHDRILGTIETVAERLLSKHMNDETELSPGELGILTTAIQKAAEMRREIHDKEGPTKRSHTVHEIKAPEMFKQLAEAVGSMALEHTKPAQLTHKKPKVTIKVADDLELENAAVEVDDEAE